MVMFQSWTNLFWGPFLESLTLTQLRYLESPTWLKRANEHAPETTKQMAMVGGNHVQSHGIEWSARYFSKPTDMPKRQTFDEPSQINVYLSIYIYRYVKYM